MDLLYMAICERLRRKGIVYKAAAMVLYAMVTEGVSYEVARDAYADWIGTEPEKLQSMLCYAVLKAGLEGSPARILEEMAGEGVNE